MNTLSITGGLVFDGCKPPAVRDVHVVDGRVVADRPAEADVVIDARGCSVLPGLIDAHCHPYGIDLDMIRLESAPSGYIAIVAARRLGRALSRGFTTIRDPAGGDAGMARAIREGLVRAPRYLWMGAALSQTGGHGDARPADSDLCGIGSHSVEVVDGVDALRRAVRERFRTGAHAIKIMASGGVVSPTDPIRIPQYSAEEIRAVVEEAARRGSYVAAHAYSPEAIRHAIGNGVHSIEHGNLLDSATAELMADAQAVLVPTLAAYDAMHRRGEELGMAEVSRRKNSEVLDAGREAILHARAAGVAIGFGTDLMGELESEQLQGLRLQFEVSGLAETIRSATVVNAALLGLDDVGRLEPGFAADALIIDGDLTRTPEALWGGERAVVAGGALVHDSRSRPIGR